MANEKDDLQQPQQKQSTDDNSAATSNKRKSISNKEIESASDNDETLAAATAAADSVEGAAATATANESDFNIGYNNNNNGAIYGDDVLNNVPMPSYITGAKRKSVEKTAIATTTMSSTKSKATTTVIANNSARSQLTDLVADVCLNGARTGSGSIVSCSDADAAITLPIGFGDCTNIRATYGTLDFNEGINIRRTEQSAVSSTTSGGCTGASTDSIQQPPSPAQQAPLMPTQNASTFSFKHFLSSGSNAFTAPSTTVTSLDPICSVAALSSTTSSATTIAAAAAAATTTTSTISSNGGHSQQKSTGARPKIPQSTPYTAADSMSSSSGRGNSTNVSSSAEIGLNVPPASGDVSGFNANSTRMKRSPRFSSFDSQASLAEYTASGGGRNTFGETEDCGGFTASCSSNGFRLYPLAGADTSSIPSTSSSTLKRPNQNSGFPNISTRATACGNFGDNCNSSSNHCTNDRHQQKQQQYVPRSYSSYEMPMPQPMSPSPRRRMADAVANVAAASSSTSANRPNRLSLHPTNPLKLRLDLPIDSAAAHVIGPSEFPPASAAALPDFVQDHWTDALYLQEMHLNSPRNSPTREIAGGAGAISSQAAWCDIGAIGGACGGNVGTCSSGNNTSNLASSTVSGAGLGSISNNFAGHEQNAGASSGVDIGAGSGGGGGGRDVTLAAAVSSTSGGASKMLPDFLSDDPIIHSSQRLADVAAGLPSNSMGSPEDQSTPSQLSTIRLENERLQLELNETRTALCEQTRRANELERQLQEENRRRTATPTAQQVMRLKQQLAEMAEELEMLRRENEALREDGAVGGYSDTTTGQRPENRFVRPVPSRSQQISQALLRAASNAENHLRQLLAGVDNLRQMAADIEDPALRLDYDGNSDIFSDFLDDCDGFEDDFPGGPAL